MKLSKETRKFLSEIGRKGGKARSNRKAQTAQENGKLGGRPPKSSTLTKS